MPGVSLSLDTEDLAQRYDRISADRQFRGGQEMLRELALNPGETVLDIGCGTGMLAEYAASLVGSAGSVVGIDPLPLRIEIAKKRVAPNLTFKVGNAYDLGEVAAESFDVVYMNAVFHWLPEKSAPLRAIRRALKPGGRFGLTTVTAERAGSWLHVIRQRVLARDPYNKYPEAQAMQNYRVSPGELEQMLLENGFAIAKLETRVSVRNASAHAAWTPESALDFAEASSFGNFLGHLPDELRAQAREDIKRELESLRARRTSDPAARESTRRPSRIIAVATRP
ncbi:MAG: methyltransferase domain-containing protein [Candidatus Binatus sp.]